MKDMSEEELQGIKACIDTELKIFTIYYSLNLDKRDILIVLRQKILVELQRRGII